MGAVGLVATAPQSAITNCPRHQRSSDRIGEKVTPTTTPVHCHDYTAASDPVTLQYGSVSMGARTAHVCMSRSAVLRMLSEPPGCFVSAGGEEGHLVQRRGSRKLDLL